MTAPCSRRQDSILKAWVVGEAGVTTATDTCTFNHFPHLEFPLDRLEAKNLHRPTEWPTDSFCYSSPFLCSWLVGFSVIIIIIIIITGSLCLTHHGRSLFIVSLCLRGRVWMAVTLPVVSPECWASLIGVLLPLLYFYCQGCVRMYVHLWEGRGIEQPEFCLPETIKWSTNHSIIQSYYYYMS